MPILKNIAYWTLTGVIGIALAVVVGGASAYWSLIFWVTYYPW